MEREAAAIAAELAEPNDALKANAHARSMAQAITSDLFYTDDVIKLALNHVVGNSVPKKALQRVKRYLRRDCRKPADMKVRDYYTHLTRINNEEIIHLPPYDDTQGLADDELMDIIQFGVPKSWIREMDRQGKDPVMMSPDELVTFLEQIEMAEDFVVPDKKKDNNKKGKKKSNQKGGNNNSDGGEHYCMLHGNNNTHSTEDCRTMKKQAKKMKGNSSGGDNGNSNNGNWKNKAKANKAKAAKELNAVAKKAAKEGAKAVVKELNAANKKRKSDDEEESDDGSLNAIEQALFETDFNKLDIDDVSC
jgi:hypothetical protein